MPSPSSGSLSWGRGWGRGSPRWRPSSTLEGAAALAETLRQKVAEHLFVFQADSIRVTISIGGALLRDGDRGGTELIKRADERLYVAKNSGRNRVCV